MKFFAPALALAAIFSAFAPAFGPAIHDYLISPTALELGDWTRVTACDDCGHVPDSDQTPPEICPHCGSESLSVRKAQPLMDSAGKWQSDSLARAYRFLDGTTSPIPDGYIFKEPNP